MSNERKGSEKNRRKRSNEESKDIQEKEGREGEEKVGAKIKGEEKKIKLYRGLLLRDTP